MLKFIKCRANANDDFIGTFTRTGNAVFNQRQGKNRALFLFRFHDAVPLTRCCQAG
ncbi:hypothetical protein ABXY35_25995 (plasmid) [Citrobacter freundii]